MLSQMSSGLFESNRVKLIHVLACDEQVMTASHTVDWKTLLKQSFTGYVGKSLSIFSY